MSTFGAETQQKPSIYGTKTLKPPKGDVGRKKHDEQTSGRVDGQGPEHGRFVMDRIT